MVGMANVELRCEPLVGESLSNAGLAGRHKENQ